MLVSVELEERPEPEIEATIYFCCLEAIHNACKYAGPEAPVRVRVAEHAGAVRFEIADDGHGFRPGPPAGTGLLNIEDRVGALGGTVEIESTTGGGVSVSGVIPDAFA